MPFTALAIGAGVGLLKSELVDRPKEQRQRALAAATQRYSPWTGLKANPIQEADPVGSALTYGSTGAQMGANMQDSAAKNNLMSAQSQWLKNNPSSYATAAPVAAAPMGSGSYNYSPGAMTPQSYNSRWLGQIGNQ